MRWLDNLIMDDRIAHIIAFVLIAIIIIAGIIHVIMIITGHPISDADIQETKARNLWLLFLQAFMRR